MMNYIVWQMPFIFFGFALCGMTIRDLWPDLLHTIRLLARR